MSHNRNNWPIGRHHPFSVRRLALEKTPKGLLKVVKKDDLKYSHVSKIFQRVGPVSDNQVMFSKGETLKAGRKLAKKRRHLVKLAKRAAKHALKLSPTRS